MPLFRAFGGWETGPQFLHCRPCRTVPLRRMRRTSRSTGYERSVRRWADEMRSATRRRGQRQGEMRRDTLRCADGALRDASSIAPLTTWKRFLEIPTLVCAPMVQSELHLFGCLPDCDGQPPSIPPRRTWTWRRLSGCALGAHPATSPFAVPPAQPHVAPSTFRALPPVPQLPLRRGHRVAKGAPGESVRARLPRMHPARLRRQWRCPSPTGQPTSADGPYLLHRAITGRAS
jgi:hypothetical protein